MKDRRRVLKAIGAISLVCSVVVILFSIPAFLTGWLYTYWGQAPALWMQPFINALIGVALLVSIMTITSFTFGNRQRALQMGVFAPILDALNRIAEGDYSARVPNNFEHIRENEPMGLLAEKVNTLAVELNRMEEMRQEFISNVSHEIQSPLTSIRGFAQALQDDRLTQAERAHYLNIIETETMRLSKLSENLLALATLDAETFQLDPKPFRLDTQIRQVVLAMEPQWHDKEIEMEVAADPVTVTGNPDLLSQVWMNLIHNSIKFTPAHGKICIGVHTHDGVVETQVADTGMGISEQDQEHVFERFFKADVSRERAKGGSGLGLAIVKEIVELHHGTIGVSSQPSAGTTFCVTLPKG